MLALLFQGHQAEQLCVLGRKALGSLLPEQGSVLALLPLPQPIRSGKLFFQGEHPGPAAVLLPAQVQDLMLHRLHKPAFRPVQRRYLRCLGQGREKGLLYRLLRLVVVPQGPQGVAVQRRIALAVEYFQPGVCAAVHGRPLPSCFL